MPKKKNRENEINEPFVFVTYTMLEHPAFRELSEAALRVLLQCKRKCNRKGVSRYDVIFKFTYPEATNKDGLRLSDSTFFRALRQLRSLGFIDFYSPGGTRNEHKEPAGYKLSKRWKEWGTPHFKEHHEGYFTSIHG